MNDKIKKIRSIINFAALKDIYCWSRPAHRGILFISIFAVIGSLLSLSATIVTKALVDGATSSDLSAIWKYGGILTALAFTRRLLGFLNSTISLKTTSNLQKHMQGLVTEAIIGKEYAFLKSYHSGELVSRIFSDCGVVQGGVMGMLPSLLTTLVSFVGAAIILFSWDWKFVPIFLAAALIGAAISFAFREPMKARHKRMHLAKDALQASTQETLENIRVIKASSSEKRAIAVISERREHLADEQIRNGRLSILLNTTMGSLFSISHLFCYLWGCVKIYQGSFTYGSLAAMIQLVGRIQSPISNAMQMVNQAYSVVASAERLQEIIGMPDEEAGAKLDSFDRIRLDQVHFRYNDGVEDVLIDVDGTIQRGDFVALTGISGGGKTSLFQLLLGIYKPTSGSVIFQNGRDEVKSCRGTRSLFAYVPQGNTLMSGTLRDNLTMFTDQATDEQIDHAVKVACLEDVVAENGLDAKLGERGIGLSEGQAQRVAIARALLSGAPILLLDESTSALDEQTEARLLENISAMRDKTVIIVTHRKAALAICDYTLHIDGGRMTRIEKQ